MILAAPLGKDMHLWGVLDGHGGREAVERLVEWLPKALAARVEKDGELSSEALIEEVERVDRQLLDVANEQKFDGGATALLLVTEGGSSAKSMRIAQIGDSQLVRCGAFGAEGMCAQHRTDNHAELARIQSQGVVPDDFGRVQGRRLSLSVTRSLGDLDLKEVCCALPLPADARPCCARHKR